MSTTTIQAALPGLPAKFSWRRFASEQPRMLIYSHDTFGLGHLRRCLKIAEAFRVVYPEVSILLVTGSPQADHYVLPRDTDLIRLPAVVKTGDGSYKPRSLSCSFEEIFEMRQNLIFEAARAFKPHMFLVDHSALGMKGEIQRTLFWLKKQNWPTSLVLGLRDILDEPEKVCADWRAQGIYAVLDDIYDWIFIYGTQEVFDPVTAYCFSEKARNKTSFTGFVAQDSGSRPSTLRTSGHEGGKQILLTLGGGEDGAKIVTTYLDVLHQFREAFNARTTVITGPFFPAEDRELLLLKAESGLLCIKTFVTDLSPYLRMADLVISMGGYNTVTEILDNAGKALIIPRCYPRKEQLLRAQRLKEMGLVECIPADRISPEALYEGVTRQLSSNAQPLAEARENQLLPLDGAAQLAKVCEPLIRCPGGGTYGRGGVRPVSTDALSEFQAQAVKVA